MLNIIIITALIASTFLTGVYLDPFFPAITDSREAKSFICWFACLLIGAYGFGRVDIKHKNKYIALFVFYTLATISMHPPFRLSIGDIDLNGFWIWPAVTQMLAYYMMYLTIANAELDKRKIFKGIFYCGFFSACYIYVQAISFDQLFSIMPHHVVLSSASPGLTSFIGQNTLAGAFIGMTIPFGFYLRRYFFMLIMAGAIILTMSKMAIAAMVIGGIFYFVLRCRKPHHVFGVIILSFVLFLGLLMGIKTGRIHIQDNGRFGHWKEVIKDFNSPQIVDEVPENAPAEIKDRLIMQNTHTWQLTGIGPGSYQYIFVSKTHSIWKQVHNEYIEVLYWGGVIGLCVFLLIVLNFLAKGLLYSNDISMAVLTTSFLIICLNAVTNFVWQVEPTRFLTVLIMGLLSA